MERKKGESKNLIVVEARGTHNFQAQSELEEIVPIDVTEEAYVSSGVPALNQKINQTILKPK